MKYDDLLGVPFKKFGRDKTGLDCYGVCIECCKRAGLTLKDAYDNTKDLTSEQVNDYINGGINLRQIKEPKVGALAYSIYKGYIHISYIIEKDKVIHSTFDKGVIVSPLKIMKPIAFYEVINESNTL